jgi:hypothetical protein
MAKDLNIHAKKLVKDGKQFEKDIGQAAKHTEKMNKQGFKGSRKHGNQFFGGASLGGGIGIGVAGFGSAAALGGTLALGKAAIKATKAFNTLGAELESTRMSMSVLLRGDEEGANTLIKEIDDLANHTSFMNSELLRGSKVLLGFGVGAKEVRKELSVLGDISAGTGADLDRLIRAYGKGKGRGVITREVTDMFTERGIALLPEMAKNMRMSTADLREEITKGNVVFEDMRKALHSMTEEGGQFYKMMNTQASTFNGRLSTSKGLMETFFARVGEPANAPFTRFLALANDEMQDLLDNTAKMDKATDLVTRFFTSMAIGALKTKHGLEDVIDNINKISSKVGLGKIFGGDKEFKGSPFAQANKARGEAERLYQMQIDGMTKELKGLDPDNFGRRMELKQKIEKAEAKMAKVGEAAFKKRFKRAREEQFIRFGHVGEVKPDGTVSTGTGGGGLSKTADELNEELKNKTAGGRVVGRKQVHVNITLEQLVNIEEQNIGGSEGITAEQAAELFEDRATEALLQVLNEGNRIAGI